MKLQFKSCERAEEVFRRSLLVFRRQERRAADRFLSNAGGRVYFAAKDVERGCREIVFFTLGNKVGDGLAGAVDLTAAKKCEFQASVASSVYSAYTEVGVDDDHKVHFMTFEKTPKTGPGVLLESNGEAVLREDVERFKEYAAALLNSGFFNNIFSNRKEPVEGMLALIRKAAERNGIRSGLTFEDKIVWDSDGKTTCCQVNLLARLIWLYGIGTADIAYMHGMPPKTPGYLEFHTHLDDTPLSNLDLTYANKIMYAKKSKIVALVEMLGQQTGKDEFDMFIFPFFRNEDWGERTPLLLRAAYIHGRCNNGDYPLTMEAVETLDRLGASAGHGKALTKLSDAIKAGEDQQSLVGIWNSLVAEIGQKIENFPHKDWKTLMREISGGAINVRQS